MIIDIIGNMMTSRDDDDESDDDDTVTTRPTTKTSIHSAETDHSDKSGGFAATTWALINRLGGTVV